MSQFLSSEIPRPLRRRLSRTQLRQRSEEDDDEEPLLQQLSRQQQQQKQMENYVKEKLYQNNAPVVTGNLSVNKNIF
jgi:hypothetical protein